MRYLRRVAAAAPAADHKRQLPDRNQRSIRHALGSCSVAGAFWAHEGPELATYQNHPVGLPAACGPHGGTPCLSSASDRLSRRAWCYLAGHGVDRRPGPAGRECWSLFLHKDLPQTAVQMMATAA